RLPRRLAARRAIPRRRPAAGLRRRRASGVTLRGPDLATDRRGGGRFPVSTKIVIDCDPGHDDAIAILLPLAPPEGDLIGAPPVAGNQTLDKTTDNALVTLEVAGRSDIPVAVGAEAPLRRDLRTAAHVHGETGLDGPELPQPSAQPVETCAADFLAELIEPA